MVNARSCLGILIILAQLHLGKATATQGQLAEIGQPCSPSERTCMCRVGATYTIKPDKEGTTPSTYKTAYCAMPDEYFVEIRITSSEQCKNISEKSVTLPTNLYFWLRFPIQESDYSGGEEGDSCVPMNAQYFVPNTTKLFSHSCTDKPDSEACDSSNATPVHPSNTGGSSGPSRPE